MTNSDYIYSIEALENSSEEVLIKLLFDLSFEGNFDTIVPEQTIIAIKNIIGLGISPNVRDGAGYSPLHGAVDFYSEPTIARVLLELGANPNAKSNQGFTPLHLAARVGRENDMKLVELLLKSGADTTIKNCYGKTPKDVSSMKVRKVFPELDPKRNIL